MILVDTSIIIQLIRGEQNRKVETFKGLVLNKIPFGISTYTVLEVLQGARNEEDFEKLRSYLTTQTVYSLPEDTAVFSDAAKRYYDLRKGGITPRGTIDVLIASTAIYHDLALLHNDKDYDNMASIIKELKFFCPATSANATREAE
jgi:predicted nucleic acid-binding protein